MSIKRSKFERKLKNKAPQAQAAPPIETAPADAAEQTAPTPEPTQTAESAAESQAPNPQGKDVKAQISDLMRKNPAPKIQGQGAEPFDEFRKRGLAAVHGAMQELAQDPTASVVRMAHPQVIQLVSGWLAKDAPDDLSIDPAAMEQQKASANSVVKLFPDNDGKWEMNELPLTDKSPLGPGVFLVRQGLTPQSTAAFDKSNATLGAANKIAQYGTSLDFGRIRSTAQKAAYEGHLNDDQISDAIDAALPNADAAKNLPLHHIVAIASAASPKKRAEYAPLIESRMRGQGADDAKTAITRHLQMLA